MGWASASYIFDSVAKPLIDQVSAGSCTPEAGTEILKPLIGQLLMGDWDTYEEEWGEYKHIPFIRDALEDTIPDIGKYDEDTEPMSQEERRRFEARSDFPGWDAL